MHQLVGTQPVLHRHYVVVHVLVAPHQGLEHRILFAGALAADGCRRSALPSLLDRLFLGLPLVLGHLFLLEFESSLCAVAARLSLRLREPLLFH